jgi:transketolase|tara:strand:- start:493 stop:888 length:396 start_codon:yes stop_codon:yes gene_type:complete
MCAFGAYVIEPAEGNGDKRQATILATGSEVEIAIAAKKILQLEGIATAVVSMPCWELFDKQPESYREEVLGKNGVRVAVEAAATFGWSRYGVDESKVVGMRSFGASAPLSDVYSYFGITTEAVVNAVRSEL